MHTYDPQKAARVWERVQSEPKQQPDRPGELRELIAHEWTVAAICRQLAQQMPAKEAAVLQNLSRDAQGQLGCLKGIYTLMTGQQAEVHAPKPEVTAPEQTLRRCYALLMRSLKEYEARAEDGEYGIVFAGLAAQKLQHCRMVLECIGNLQKR